MRQVMEKAKTRKAERQKGALDPRPGCLTTKGGEKTTSQ